MFCVVYLVWLPFDILPIVYTKLTLCLLTLLETRATGCLEGRAETPTDPAVAPAPSRSARDGKKIGTG